MREQEYERVFLVQELPEDIAAYERVEIEIGDFFESNAVDALKVRRKGESCELIKKEGSLEQGRTEHRILIKRGEFDALFKATVQHHSKTRYFYPVGEFWSEIDIYHGRLEGYVRVEVEFPSLAAMQAFKPPMWFGPEITALNHEIHEDLGLISFDEMRERFARHSITLAKTMPAQRS